MASRSLQIQTVLYKNDPGDVLKALDALHNALTVDKPSLGQIRCATICYGDASPAALFDTSEIDMLNDRYAGVPTVSYTFFDKNTGTALGHNRLAEGCASDFIMVMNPDVLVSPDFFEMMLLPFDDTHLNAGLVEARQTPIEHPKEYEIGTGITSWASTASVLFPTSLFRKVGGFDADTFFMYCDDVDFSWRIRLAGYDIVYQPLAPVFHAKRLSATGDWQPTPAELYYSAEAALLMAYKWSNPVRCKQLLALFQKSESPEQQKAALVFLSREKEGTLPEQLDKEHKVAVFVSDNFAQHRFAL